MTPTLVAATLGFMASCTGCSSRPPASPLYANIRDQQADRLIRAKFDRPMERDERIAAAWSLVALSSVDRVYHDPAKGRILIVPPNDHRDGKRAAPWTPFLLTFNDDGSLQSWSRPADLLPRPQSARSGRAPEPLFPDDQYQVPSEFLPTKRPFLVISTIAEGAS